MREQTYSAAIVDSAGIESKVECAQMCRHEDGMATLYVFDEAFGCELVAAFFQPRSIILTRKQ